MLKMITHVVSVRYGTIEENSQKWAKVQTIEDDIEDSKGFIGQRVVEYAVPHDSVNSVQANATQNQTVPGSCNLEFMTMMSGGKAILKCIGLKKFVKT